MGDLLVECPIHLDAVSIKDILVFRCGHGFCEPCLEEHFAHNGPNHLSCPTCRKPVRRKEAFPLFLAPAQPGATQSSHPTAEALHTRLFMELKEARAAHANCSGRFIGLQHEIDTLRQDGAHYNQTILLLRGRYELSEERLAREADNSARAREESNRMREEVTKLQVENHKTSKALEQALQDVQVQLERVKVFQGYIERYKHKCTLERKKRKAIENAGHHPLSRKEDDSLMVVDANAPDMLYQDGPDFGWLDEACKVKGDRFGIPRDEDSELEKESEDEVQLIDPITKAKQRVSRSDADEGGNMQYLLHPKGDGAPEPSLRFHSDWNLGLEALAGPSSETTRRRKHGGKQAGGSKLVKVKMSVGAGTHKPVGGPLAIDRQGHIKGAVALGPRQKLNSKN